MAFFSSRHLAKKVKNNRTKWIMSVSVHIFYLIFLTFLYLARPTFSDNVFLSSFPLLSIFLVASGTSSLFPLALMIDRYGEEKGYVRSFIECLLTRDENKASLQFKFLFIGFLIYLQLSVLVYSYVIFIHVGRVDLFSFP